MVSRARLLVDDEERKRRGQPHLVTLRNRARRMHEHEVPHGAPANDGGETTTALLGLHNFL